MGSRDKVYGSSPEGLKIQHQICKFLIRKNHPVPAALAYLIVLTVLAVKRTAAEEDHARALLPCYGRLLAPVKAGPRHAYFRALAAATELVLGSVHAAIVGTQLTAAVRRCFFIFHSIDPWG